MLQVFPQPTPTLWLDLWGQSVRHRLEVAIILVAIVWCWGTTIEGTAFYGRKPDFTWMIFACIACYIMYRLVKDGRLKQLAQVNFGSDVARRELASLIVQLRLILTGNSIEIVVLVAQGIEWHPTDWFNVICVSAGMGLFLFFALLRRLGWLNKWLPFLDALKWNGDWAKCWYTLNLKAIPQGVQIYSVWVGYTHPEMLFVSLLLFLGAYRVKNAVTSSGWQKPVSIVTTIDALTIVGLVATVAHHTWPQFWPGAVDFLVYLFGVLR